MFDFADENILKIENSKELKDADKKNETLSKEMIAEIKVCIDVFGKSNNPNDKEIQKQLLDTLNNFSSTKTIDIQIINNIIEYKNNLISKQQQLPNLPQNLFPPFNRMMMPIPGQLPFPNFNNMPVHNIQGNMNNMIPLNMNPNISQNMNPNMNPNITLPLANFPNPNSMKPPSKYL